jgi:hypothetical protein
MCPGLSTLTRIPRSFRSTIQVRANERTAALLALYTPRGGNPLAEAIDPVRITDAADDRRGSAFRTVNKRPRTLVLNILSKCPSVTSPNGPSS